jgi:cardiolipin synthase
MKQVKRHVDIISRSARRTLLACAVLAHFTGCAGTPTYDPADDSVSPSLPRQAVAVLQLVDLGTRSVLLDPIVRPVSYQAAFYSSVIKSTGGFLRRISISAIEFPALRSQPIPPLADTGSMNLAKFETHLDEMTGRSSSCGSIEVLVDGHEYFPRLLQAVARAEHSIDVRTYIFDNDDVALEIADALKRRSGSVKVNVLVDGIGQVLGSQADAESLPPDHLPVNSVSAYLRRGSAVKVRRQTNPWLTGDHVKTTIIDEDLAFVGGMNIGREYRHEWHDAMMAVEGPVVDELKREFDIAWQRAGLAGDAAFLAANLKPVKVREDCGGYPIRTLVTRPYNSEIYNAQLAAIRMAKSRIYIENAYFSDDLTLYELARARRRGVDVRVIIPAEGNHESMNRSNAVAVNVMLRHGIRVFRYPGMSHIKAAVFDGWVSLGSANFDKMSLQINRELNLATANPDAVKQVLDKIFVPDFEVSDEVLSPQPLTIANHVAELFADELL